MIKKSTLERIIGDDLAELWNALTQEEKAYFMREALKEASLAVKDNFPQISGMSVTRRIR